MTTGRVVKLRIRACQCHGLELQRFMASDVGIVVIVILLHSGLRSACKRGGGVTAAACTGVKGGSGVSHGLFSATHGVIQSICSCGSPAARRSCAYAPHVLFLVAFSSFKSILVGQGC